MNSDNNITYDKKYLLRLYDIFNNHFGFREEIEYKLIKSYHNDYPYLSFDYIKENELYYDSDNIKYNMKFIQETKQNIINEKKGVALYDHRYIMTNIINYISDYIKHRGLPAFFTIPTEILHFDFIKKIVIIISIDNIKLDISGKARYSDNIKLTDDGKIDKIIIYLEGGMNDKKELDIYGLSSTLYHEFNHIYEIYMDLLTKKNIDRFNKSIKKSKIKVDDIFSGKAVIECFETIIYRLFSETEFNALVASIYGYLRISHPMKHRVYDHIKYTKYHKILENIEKNYIALLSYINEDNYLIIIDKLKEYGIDIRYRNNNCNSFKNAFKAKIEYYLDKLKKKVDRVIDLYFDTEDLIYESTAEDIVYEINLEPRYE